MFALKNENQLYCLWLAYWAYSGQAPKNVSGLMSCGTPSSRPGCGNSVPSAGGAALPSRTAKPKPSRSQLLTHGKRIALFAIVCERLLMTSELKKVVRASVLYVRTHHQVRWTLLGPISIMHGWSFTESHSSTGSCGLLSPHGQTWKVSRLFAKHG